MEEKIIWATSCVYSKGAVIAAHSHKFYHYFYVKKGSGYLKIENKEYEAKEGHIYLFSPEKIHEIHSGENGLIAYEIKFNEGDEKTVAALSTLPEELILPDRGIEEAFEAIFNEMRSAFAYRDEMLSLKFRELLLLLLRSYDFLSQQKESRVYFSEKFAEVLFYMDEHLSEKVSLQKLADIAHLEKIYFLKRFKEEMNTTPMNYLMNLRLNEAKKLLLHSDMNITQISSAVGFPGVHHFSGAFKKFFGISPSRYKTKSKAE